MASSRFAGKVALVTGGSRGIGRATALQLAREGASVMIQFNHRAEAATSLLDAIRASGGAAASVQGDASQPVSSRALVRAVIDRFARLDIVVANAGIDGSGRLADTRPDKWQEVLATNLFGPFALAQAAAPLLADHGSMVLVASISGLVASAEGLDYSASKAGLLHLTRNLAVALAPRHRVNAVAPGMVMTDMTRATLTDPAGAKAVLGTTPLGRWGEPDDIAKAIAFLASDDARFMTGATLVVDGGASLYWSVGGSE